MWPTDIKGILVGGVMTIVIILVSASEIAAVAFTEPLNDAGSLPNNAFTLFTRQAERVTSISGSLNNPSDIDVYQLRLTNSFSIQTVSTGRAFDTQLFLFERGGFGGSGMCANDDIGPGNLFSRLTFSACGMPSLGGGGTQFLAVSGYNIDPVGRAGFIFPDPQFNPNGSVGTFGPQHSGRDGILTGWAGSPGEMFTRGGYRINLSNVLTIPRPGNGGGEGDSGPSPGGDDETRKPPENFGFPPFNGLPLCSQVVFRDPIEFCRRDPAPEPPTVFLLSMGLFALILYLNSRKQRVISG